MTEVYVDIDDHSLEYARANVLNNGLEQRIKTISVSNSGPIFPAELFRYVDGFQGHVWRTDNSLVYALSLILACAIPHSILTEKKCYAQQRLKNWSRMLYVRVQRTR